jgi:AraC-like DNA-binding protein
MLDAIILVVRSDRPFDFFAQFAMNLDEFGDPSDIEMRPIPPGSCRIGPILSLPALLRERGVEPKEIFAQAQVNPRLFTDAENVMAYRDLGRLLAISASTIRCPYLGLLIGERCSTAELGPVGLLAAQAPDVDAALRDFVRYMSLFDRAAVVSLAVDGDAATFSYTIVEPDIPAAEHIREGSLAIMVRILRDLCGASWAPDIVMFPHKARGTLLPYLKYFQAPVHFGREMTAIVFPARWLSRRVCSADQTSRSALQAQITNENAETAGSFSDRVRHKIQASVPQGQAGEAAIARSFGMDPSSLRRRLAREGTSFRTIVQDIRYEAAKLLIRESDLTLAEIAIALGYAEISVFTRAFRRWSGVTPSEWRGRNGSD